MLYYLLGGAEEVSISGGTTTLTKYYSAPGLPTALRQGSTISYLATDGLGSVTAAFDGSGNLVAAQLYLPYAEAARSMGFAPARIVLVHLLPNSLGPALTQAAMDMATAMMVAAGLSFIGFGVQPPTPEWGLMINEGSSYIVSGQWWVTFFPGLAILSVVTGFILVDDGIKRMRG